MLGSVLGAMWAGVSSTLELGLRIEAGGQGESESGLAISQENSRAEALGRGLLRAQPSGTKYIPSKAICRIIWMNG